MGSTSVMMEVTALSISISSVSSSRSRWRREFSKEVGAGSDALGGGAGGFLGETAGFDGAADNVMLGRFGSEAFDAGGTHEGIPLARTGAARANDL